MPRGDGTGPPWGSGPGTGRGLGKGAGRMGGTRPGAGPVENVCVPVVELLLPIRRGCRVISGAVPSAER